MAAPYSLTARSKLASGRPVVLGVAVDEREVEVVLVLERARRAQLLGGVVDPGDRAPRRASQAPK